ncbi:LysE family translocator [Pseudoalteromonas xiamenensis]|uniref:LysE family translocator n=1 Tax=Pseudoalteromonas xiamenensis TaxID=882626 RepID=UPI0035ED894B
MDYLLAITLFAFASSVTPGPNNILVMSSGVNFGMWRSVPLLCGICVGFAFMVVLVGLGFSQVFERFPEFHVWLKVAGVLYLLYLAWLIGTSNSTLEIKAQGKPLTFTNGALFQWVNAKAWVVATGAIATFTDSGNEAGLGYLIIGLVYLFVAFPSVGIWLWFGSFLSRFLHTTRNHRRFNYVMASLLALSILPVLNELFLVLLNTSN